MAFQCEFQRFFQPAIRITIIASRATSHQADELYFKMTRNRFVSILAGCLRVFRVPAGSLMGTFYLAYELRDM